MDWLRCLHKYHEDTAGDSQEDVEDRSRMFCAERKTESNGTENKVRPGPQSKGTGCQHNCRGGQKRNRQVCHDYRKMSRSRRINRKKKYRSQSDGGTKGPAQGKR